MAPLNVLLSSAGRRVALLRALQRDLLDLGLQGSVVAADASDDAAAIHDAVRSHRVPLCSAPDFVPALLRVCDEEKIRLVVPTIDTELPVLSSHRDEFETRGTRVLVSATETIEIAGDKDRTHNWLVTNGFATVRQGRPSDVLAAPDSWSFPLVAKPRQGSASVGVRTVGDPDDLTLAVRNGDFIVQERAAGAEYTLDVLVNRDGHTVCVVPRRRLEIRAGEVSKAVTVRCDVLEKLGRDIADALPGAYGPITIQVFVAEDDDPRVIEINPRFGGGYPLSWAAGARFPRWLYEELEGMSSTAAADGWQDGLLMLRYDEAVFVPMTSA